MKTACLLILLSLGTITALAQGPEPVKWIFTAKKITDNQYEIHLAATIDRGWHIYSQTTPDGGPVRTTISFSKNPLLTLQGTVAEGGKLEQHFDDLFGVDVKQFSDKVDFVQKVTVKGKVKTNITGSIEFMVCNNTMCLPPKSLPFTILLNK